VGRKLKHFRAKGAYDLAHFPIAATAGFKATEAVRALRCSLSYVIRQFDYHLASGGLRL
jgi:hypothetical protein